MVIFFDIDGTIIDDATQVIPASAASAIAALVRNGHVPVVNTGRPFGHIDPRVRALPFRGYVCACGMERILDGLVRFRVRPTRPCAATPWNPSGPAASTPFMRAKTPSSPTDAGPYARPG